MRRFISQTFGDGVLIAAAVSIIIGVVLGIGSSPSWFWLCLPIILFIN